MAEKYSVVQIMNNFLVVYEVSGTLRYHSYSTLVAFQTKEGRLVVCQNIWSRTTGKHLNYLDGGRKEERVSPEMFKLILEGKEELGCEVGRQVKPENGERLEK